MDKIKLLCGVLSLATASGCFLQPHGSQACTDESCSDDFGTVVDDRDPCPEADWFTVAVNLDATGCGVAFGDQAQRREEALALAGCESEDDCLLREDDFSASAVSVAVSRTEDGLRFWEAYEKAYLCSEGFPDDEALAKCTDDDRPGCVIECRAVLEGCEDCCQPTGASCSDDDECCAPDLCLPFTSQVSKCGQPEPEPDPDEPAPGGDDDCNSNGDCGYKEKCTAGNCRAVECTNDSQCGSCSRCSSNVCRDCGSGPYGCYC